MHCRFYPAVTAVTSLPARSNSSESMRKAPDPNLQARASSAARPPKQRRPGRQKSDKVRDEPSRRPPVPLRARRRPRRRGAGGARRRFLFTLCGGHIAPILVAAKARGIRVVDARDEATAVFAADAVARLTGKPGVAAVTAGPGVTNALTALEKRQTGAIATAADRRRSADRAAGARRAAGHRPGPGRPRRSSNGRDACDGCATLRRRLPKRSPSRARACRVRSSSNARPICSTTRSPFANGIATRQAKELRSPTACCAFISSATPPACSPARRRRRRLPRARLSRRRRRRRKWKRRRRGLPPPSDRWSSSAARPLVGAEDPTRVAQALSRLGAPVYLSGMARGLLGRHHPLQRLHQRRQALREADCVLLAGAPCDFRLDYGRHVRRSANLIAANRSATEARLNRRPDVAAIGDAGDFLVRLASRVQGLAERRADWHATLRARDEAREREIDARAKTAGEFVNPIALLRAIDSVAADDATFVADGAISSPRLPTRCARARPAAGSIPACSARSASAPALRSPPRSNGRAPKCGSCSATAPAAGA